MLKIYFIYYCFILHVGTPAWTKLVACPGQPFNKQPDGFRKNQLPGTMKLLQPAERAVVDKLMSFNPTHRVSAREATALIHSLI